MADTYQYYQQIIQSEKLPLAMVDMEFLDKNIEEIQKRAKSYKIRIATKSVRCKSLLEYIKNKCVDQISGFMCFHIDEALWLASEGFEDIMVAYPYVRNLDQYESIFLKDLTFMVDRLEHLESLELLAQKNNYSFKICFDIDLSTNFGPIHFGVYRSSLKTLTDVKNLFYKMSKYSKLKLVAIMGYEAQIAGVADKNPFKKFFNIPIRLLKNSSLSKIQNKRKEIVQFLKSQGVKLEFVNGGGTVKSFIKFLISGLKLESYAGKAKR